MERDALALGALHQLAAQFAADSDFGQLMHSLLLTLSGQVAVPGVMAIIRRLGIPSVHPTVYAVGPLANRERELPDTGSVRCWRCLEHESSPCLGHCTDDWSDRAPESICLLQRYGLSAVVPLVHKQTLFGFIGVGRKHDGQTLDEDDVTRLKAVVASVTPLLTNSYLLSDLSATKQWYASLLDDVPQAMFVCSATGKPRMLNQTARTLVLDMTGGEVDLGDTTPPLTEILTTIELPRAVRRFLTEESAGQPEPCTVLDSQSGRVYSLSLARIYGGAASHCDKVLLLDDVSHARETESQLLELEKLAERGAMVSSIAHEIRNILAVLHGGVELTQIAIKRGDRAKAESYLGRVLENVRHLDRFTTELMDNRKGQLQTQLASLNDLASNVITFLRIQSRFKAIRVISDFDPNLPAVEVDTDRITQVLMNLINNSADAIREAGRSEGEITVRTTVDRDRVILLVADNGCGMPPEVREKLFLQRFTTKRDGHGFGLVTCARIIAGHHATINVDTEPGSYTRIQISFPSV